MQDVTAICDCDTDLNLPAAWWIGPRICRAGAKYDAARASGIAAALLLLGLLANLTVIFSVAPGGT